MNNPATQNTALAEAFAHRIAQLGLSRREFAKRSGLSRQTIHHIENECRTDLAPSTFEALDVALRWGTGKSYALANGLAWSDLQDDNARALELKWKMVQRLDTLSIEELEAMVYQWADNLEDASEPER